MSFSTCNSYSPCGVWIPQGCVEYEFHRGVWNSNGVAHWVVDCVLCALFVSWSYACIGCITSFQNLHQRKDKNKNKQTDKKAKQNKTKKPNLSEYAFCADCTWTNHWSRPVVPMVCGDIIKNRRALKFDPRGHGLQAQFGPFSLLFWGQKHFPRSRDSPGALQYQMDMGVQ